MSVFKRKSRMVSFRVSEEEYRVLREASLSRGARSVSDFARDTLFAEKIVFPSFPDDGLEAKVNRLASDLGALSHEVQVLRTLVPFHQPRQ